MNSEPHKGRQALTAALIAALLLMVAPILVVLVARRVFDGGSSPSAQPESGPDAARPRALALDPVQIRETRKEGSRFDGLAMGSLEGTMTQQAKVDVYLPIFEGEIRSLWVAPWSVHFKAEVLRNDGHVIEERRTFEEVRSVELLTPARLTRLQYELGPEVNKAILGVAASLADLTGGASVPLGMAMVKSQDLDYAAVSRLTGIDERVLARQEGMVVGAARILNEFEGKQVDLRMRDGKVEWVYAPDLPRKLVTTLGRVQSLLDYSALPSPTLAVGEQTTLTDLFLNELFPPELTSEWFGDYDVQLSLTLVRLPDQTVDQRTLAHFDGTGMLHLMQADGNVYAKLAVESATLLIDRTEQDNRFLHRLELATPVQTGFLDQQSRFREVQWDGDLSLRLLYRVDLEP